MSYEVKFRHVVQIIGGVGHLARIGLGPDGTVWLDVDEMGITPEDVMKMADCPGSGPLVLLDDDQQRVYASAQGLARIQANPEIRKAMFKTIEMLQGKLRAAQLKNDPLRNN